MLPTTYPSNAILEPNDIHDFYQYIFDNIKAYVVGRTLVAGAMLDILASIMIQQNFQVHLNANYEFPSENLAEKYKGKDSVRMIHKINFLSSQFATNYSNLKGIFNNLILLNLFYTQEENELTIKNASNLLLDNGNIIIAMPSLTAAFNFNRFNHEDWKQLDRHPLTKFLSPLTILKTRYYDLPSKGIYVAVIAKK